MKDDKVRFKRVVFDEDVNDYVVVDYLYKVDGTELVLIIVIVKIIQPEKMILGFNGVEVKNMI